MASAVPITPFAASSAIYGPGPATAEDADADVLARDLLERAAQLTEH